MLEIVSLKNWSHPKNIYHCFTYMLLSLSVPTVGASFGPGYGLIHLYDVQCVGTEARLVDCVTSTTSAVCSHSEDAGVKCYIQTGMGVRACRILPAKF